MENLLKEKYNLMLKIERYEKAILELNNWKEGLHLSKSTTQLIESICNNRNTRENLIEILEDVCSKDKDRKRSNNGRLYLSEIVEKEKPAFGKNNLILAPTGSGKTHLMKNLIKSKEVLLLVSTTSLKESLVPESEDEREKLSNRMYSTKREKVYGEGDYKILVMTYAEFSNKLQFRNEFANQFEQIFCDEIHSLFNYYFFSNEKIKFTIIIRYLFENEGRNQEIYYFTATDDYLKTFQEKEYAEFFKDVKVFDYLNHPEIIKNMVLSSYKINNIEQVKPHLKSRKKSFKHFKYKIFAYCRTISKQIKLKEMLEKEGFKVLVLWSINNKDYPMSKKQLKHREYVLRTGLIPEEYDVLIINSSMQEGWDLVDKKVKCVIMNTTNQTEFAQAIGRVRGDIDLLLYRSDSFEFDCFVNFPDELINKDLTTEDKRNLCEKLDVRNFKGNVLKWTSIKSILIKQGYVIKDKSVYINGKLTRVSSVEHSEETI